MNEFYSQFGEDKWLVENNILPEKGFFLDIGAGDYKNLSNTYHFERKGWQGICVEADPRQLSGLVAYRKNVVFAAVTNYLGLTDFYLNNDIADISRIIPEGNETRVSVATTTIPLLIRHFGIEKLEIDLLSIDIEGSEVPVLRDMFSDRIFPKVIIVEYMTSGIDHTKEIQLVMNDYPYELIHTTNANFIYKFIDYD